MLVLNDAMDIVRTNIPNCIIKKHVIYKDMFVFLVYTNDKVEGGYDPFYSVDRKTSEFDGFPILKHEIFNEVMDLFKSAKPL